MTTHRAAVLGRPIAHSISPALHQAAYDELGLLDWSYDRFEHDDITFPGFFRDLGAEWRGLSLTMPLKEVATGLADRLSPTAQATGAVNTITWVDEGPDGSARTAVGDNTDVHGIVEGLRSGGLLRAETACVLGAGATARSAVAALAQLGAGRVTLFSRSKERSERALALAADLGISAAWVPLRRLDLLGGADAVISALPMGAADLLAQSLRDGGVDGDPFSGSAGVLLDAVYMNWPTPLGAAWADAGGVAVSGFEMLLHQAAAQVQLMTGQPAPVEAMRKAGLAVL